MSKAAGRLPVFLEARVVRRRIPAAAIRIILTPEQSARIFILSVKVISSGRAGYRQLEETASLVADPLLVVRNTLFTSV